MWPHRPAFGEAGAPSWPKEAKTPVVLPYYHAWGFRTGEAGDSRRWPTGSTPA